MAVRREYHDALNVSGSRILLLAGGGNDLLGEGRFSALLRNFVDGAGPADLINNEALEASANRIIGFYRQILVDVEHHHPDVTIFGHGYDTPFPKAGGNYFGTPFEAAGIPLELGRDVVRLIVDYFANRLASLADEFTNYRFVDLTGAVGDHPKSWDDELHPENAGFKRAADRLIGAVRSHLANLPPVAFEASPVVAADGFEAGAARTVVLDPGHGGTQSLPGASWNNAIGPSGSLEKTWTLDVCLRARSLLEAKGYRILMTRNTDTNLSGSARRNVAKHSEADCFVSVHFNASRRHNAQGTETFIHTTTTSPKSISLMHAVQASMVAALGHRDRNNTNGVNGVLRASHSVTRESGHFPGTAVCLHEVSFMDRLDEETRIKQSSYRDRIAGAIADGIEAYLSEGFETASVTEIADGGDYDDAIHARAAEQGLTVVQYLGFAEALDTGEPLPQATTQFEARSGAGHVDGSMLPVATGQTAGPAPNSSIVDAMFSDAALLMSSPGREPDADENAFIDPSVGFDFSQMGQDPAAFAEAFSGFESSGFDYAGFAAFIDTLGLRYFAASEFLYLGAGNQSGGCAGRNSPPPESLWENIADTAVMIDEIRHRLGYPVRIISGYRSPTYNSCIGGNAGSRHKRFDALDWTCSSGTVAQWHEAAVAVRGSNSRFGGGIGRYNSSRFIHIDTRGYFADWTQ